MQLVALGRFWILSVDGVVVAVVAVDDVGVAVGVVVVVVDDVDAFQRVLSSSSPMPLMIP